MIGGLDVGTTKQIEKKLKRKLLRENPRSEQNKLSKTCQEKNNNSSESEGENVREENPDCEEPRQTQSPTSTSRANNSSESEGENVREKNPDCEEPSQIQSPTSTSIDSVDYALLSKMCDRFGVSDRAGAAIASAVLSASSSQIIDKSKLRRERKKTREIVIKEQTVSEIPALYFDGRKDQTMTVIEKDGKKYQRRILEEHISLIKEPGSKS